MNFRINLTQFYFNFSRQKHQIDVLYVSFNTRDSQVSSCTPFYFSFTVPLRKLSILSNIFGFVGLEGNMEYQDEK